MSDNLMRTFISIPVPNEVKSKKNMLYSTLENSPSNISWVKNDQLHLTLKFLGHTPEASFDNIKSEISKIASTINPPSITTGINKATVRAKRCMLQRDCLYHGKREY